MVKKPIKKVCELECQCEGPGHCPVYGLYMSKPMWKKCKYSDSHRCTFARFFARAGISPLTNEQRKHHIEKAEQYRTMNVKSEDIQKLDDTIQKIEQEGVTLENYEEKKEGLGDLIGNVLSKVGVTEETIQNWAGISGCGCSKRKKFLNKIMSFRK